MARNLLLTMAGVADETAIIAGLSGSGDTNTIGIASGTPGHVDANGTGALAEIAGYPWWRWDQASGAASYVDINLATAVGTLTLAGGLVTPAAWPSSSFAIFIMRSTAGDVAKCTLGGTGSAGQIRLQNSAGVVKQSASPGPMAVNKAYWWNLSVSVGASGVGRLRTWDLTGWTSGDITANTPTWDSRVENAGVDPVANYGTTNVSYVRIGNSAATPVIATWAEGQLVGDDTVTTIGGPLASLVPSGPTRVWKRWNGTVWVPAAAARKGTTGLVAE